MVPSAPFFQKVKTIVQFIWRYFFTLITACFMFSVWIENPIILKNALITYLITFFVDWVKMFIKVSHLSYSAEEFYQDHHRRSEHFERSNACRPGTAAYHLTNLGRPY
jgi:hypothetical protein